MLIQPPLPSHIDNTRDKTFLRAYAKQVYNFCVAVQSKLDLQMVTVADIELYDNNMWAERYRSYAPMLAQQERETSQEYRNALSALKHMSESYNGSITPIFWQNTRRRPIQNTDFLKFLDLAAYVSHLVLMCVNQAKIFTTTQYELKNAVKFLEATITEDEEFKHSLAFKKGEVEQFFEVMAPQIKVITERIVTSFVKEVEAQDAVLRRDNARREDAKHYARQVYGLQVRVHHLEDTLKHRVQIAGLTHKMLHAQIQNVNSTRQQVLRKVQSIESKSINYEIKELSFSPEQLAADLENAKHEFKHIARTRQKVSKMLRTLELSRQVKINTDIEAAIKKEVAHFKSQELVASCDHHVAKLVEMNESLQQPGELKQEMENAMETLSDVRERETKCQNLANNLDLIQGLTYPSLWKKLNKLPALPSAASHKELRTQRYLGATNANRILNETRSKCKEIESLVDKLISVREKYAAVATEFTDKAEVQFKAFREKAGMAFEENEMLISINETKQRIENSFREMETVLNGKAAAIEELAKKPKVVETITSQERLEQVVSEILKSQFAKTYEDMNTSSTLGERLVEMAESQIKEALETCWTNNAYTKELEVKATVAYTKVYAVYARSLEMLYLQRYCVHAFKQLEDIKNEEAQKTKDLLERAAKDDEVLRAFMEHKALQEKVKIFETQVEQMEQRLCFTMLDFHSGCLDLALLQAEASKLFWQKKKKKTDFLDWNRAVEAHDGYMAVLNLVEDEGMSEERLKFKEIVSKFERLTAVHNELLWMN